MMDIEQFPIDEPIVSMLEFKGRVLVATSRRIFEVVGKELVLLKFESAEQFVPPAPSIHDD